MSIPTVSETHVANVAAMTRGEDRAAIKIIIQGGYKEVMRRGLPTPPDFSKGPESERPKRIKEWLNNKEVKAMQNGIAGIFIQEIFERVKKTPEYQHPSDNFLKVVQYANDNLGDPKIRFFGSPLKKVWLLSRYTNVVCLDAVRRWNETIEGEKLIQHFPNALNPEQKDRLAAFKWLSEVLPLHSETGLPGAKDFPTTVERFINGGFGTASFAIWGSLHVLPKVVEDFQRKKHKPLTQQEIDDIQILPFISGLASGNKELSIPILDAIIGTQKGEKAWQTSRRPFIPDFLEISEVQKTDHGVLVTNPNGSPVIERFLNLDYDKIPALYDGYHEQWFSQIHTHTTGTGCPAGPYIQELLEWSKNLYKKYGLPEAKPIRSSRRWF